MTDKINYIEILANKVYVEYTNFNSEYLSFTKAKRLLKSVGADKLKYFCSDNEKSVNFINALSFYKYKNGILHKDI